MNDVTWLINRCIKYLLKSLKKVNIHNAVFLCKQSAFKTISYRDVHMNMKLWSIPLLLVLVSLSSDFKN